jgi:hypothetical protein
MKNLLLAFFYVNSLLDSDTRAAQPDLKVFAPPATPARSG